MLKNKPFTFTILFLAALNLAVAQNPSKEDSTASKTAFPYFKKWSDTYLTRFNYKLSPLLSLSPDSAKTKVNYNRENNTFNTSEKIGSSIELKKPQSLSFNEYSSLQNVALRRSIIRDIEKAQDGSSAFGGKRGNPLLAKNPIMDRLFGDKVPEFKPNGFISVDFKVGSRYVNNPTLALIQREQNDFVFDQQIAVNFNNLFNDSSDNPEGENVNEEPKEDTKSPQLSDLTNVLKRAGQVREKMNILGNFDTKSAFQFENKFKMNFKNDPEDILQKVELGNVSMPNRSQLIPGVQNLLGAKIGLKFGKLDIATVIAQQNSRTESIIINGGNQSRSFEVRCDNYEENKHFFLSQVFRDNYQGSLKNLPIVTSQLRITRIEVYVTNRTSNVSSMRNLAGLADLGEKNPFKKDNITVNNSILSADNKINNLFANVASDPNFRSIDNTNNALRGLGLDNGKDYEILRGAKKLTEREYEIQSELGYISLLTPLRNDEVLAVAYEYTYKGKAYKVGELSEDYVSRKEEEVIVLKLLKSSTIRNNLSNPMWNLMMKNIYTLSQGSIKKEGFQLRIVYKDDQSGLDSPNLKEGGKELKDVPLIKALNLDRLNFNNDLLADGNFDYVEGVTISERNGRIIFPVLEPFGSHLATKFDPSEAGLQEKYVFNELYSKTLTDAQQVSLKNKFFISGSVQVGSAEISLPLGASGSSVRIYAGGTELKEGVDYEIDGQVGRVVIKNQSILSSGRQIRIDYEKPDIFRAQARRLFGIRLDYSIGRDIRIGATMLSLQETVPGFITRTSLGSEPVNNLQWGIDVNLKKDLTGLTRMLDALPGIQTKEPSSILLTAEFAQLRPGVNNKRIKGSSMIDDFEFARNTNDLTRQPAKWRLGSTPKNILDSSKAILTNPYAYNYNRAKLAAYSVDPSTYTDNGFGSVGVIPDEVRNQANNNIYTRAFNIQEVIPGRSTQAFTQQLPSSILDLAYFPKEPGMYNYNPNLDASGFLENPKNSFGSIMRGITFDADFDNSNVEFIEAWILNPFGDAVQDGTPNGNKSNTTGGKLLIQLGDISEDVIPDSRFNFENGIKKGTNANSNPVETKWGFAPRTQFITDAFDNQKESRSKQDVGLDGLSNEEERTFPHIAKYLNDVSLKVTDPLAIAKIKNDPSKDDFKFFLDPSFDKAGDATFLQRFQNYAGMENNAPVANDTATVDNLANTNLADKEDINQDNTINEVEDYYQYEIDFQPGQLEVGKGYIVDKIEKSDAIKWYLFRIPIRKPSIKGKTDIDGFKSIRFIRLVTTDWEQPVVLRFASLQFVSNQYRVYANSLSDKGEIEKLETDNTVKFNVSSVNVEENGCPVDGECNIKPGTTPYVVPPGFVRDRDFNTSPATNVFQNEQSLKLAVENLKGGQARAIFRNTKADLNMYKRIKMFIHSENKENLDGIGAAFLRIGTDLKNNYYEIEIPKLKNTVNGSVNDPTIIWPKENEIDIPLSVLRNLKLRRNKNNIPFNKIYGDEKPTIVRGTISGGINETQDSISREYIIRVKGNPDLSNVLTMMIGLKNNDTINNTVGKEFSAWFDELRVFGFDQENGEAGILSTDIKLADIGTVSINGNFSNYGYGGVQDRISSRSREFNQGFGIASTLDIDKFFPLNWGLSIPLFVNYDNQKVRPTFNPLDPDIRLEDAINNKSEFQQNLSSQLVEENAITKGFNFTNVRKIKTKAGAKNHFYDIENFTFSYAQNKMTRTNILLAQFLQTQNRAGLSYQYQPKTRSWSPFKNSKTLTNKPIIKNLKEFNLSLIPSTIGFRSDYDRSFISNTYRTAQLDVKGVTPNVIKYFLGNRYYDAQWDLTKSINVSYSSQMTAIQDDVKEITNDEVSFITGLKTLGRPKQYTQKIQATYTLPLDKFYLLDWLNVDSRFNNNYGYTAGTFYTKGDTAAFGNLLENGRELGFNGKVDFVKLYNKLKFLKLANTPSPPTQRFTRTPGDDEEIKLPPPAFTKNLTRLLMTVRGINFNLSLIETTLLPGFIPKPKFFGLDNSFNNAPGLGFVMGSQKRDIHKTASENGWLSKNILQNNPFTQTRGLKFDYNTNLEPFKGFRMQIKGNLSRGDSFSYQEIYSKDKNGIETITPILNPVRNGNFSMSFWSFKTSFKKLSGDPATLYKYAIFDSLVSYRQNVITRLKILNPDKEGDYDKNSQDVLIPAFFSAYSGQNLDKIFEKSKKRGSNTFNPFLSFPMPNWRIDYQGLEKLPGLKKLFNSITLSHSYTSIYSVGNFTSSLEYNDIDVLGLTNRDYSLGKKIGENNLFIPTFIMSTISMEERFSPFIGIQFTTKSSLTGSFNWNKERKAALNLSNAQVAETNGNDFVFGIGFRKNNVKLPFRKADGNKIVLKNDLDCRIDVSSKDLKILQRRLDGDVVPIQGNYFLQIRPQVQYQINKKINLGMYFEKIINTPFTSLSYENRSSYFGINARFNLSD